MQLCGDAHILNFGLPATPERNLSFDLRDFDEAIGAFARAYADQTERDHRQLVDAIARGTIASEIG